MNKVIVTARLLFIVITVVTLFAAVYMYVHRDAVNGSNALTVLITAGAFVGAIASWQMNRK